VHDADTDGLTVLVLYVTSRFFRLTSRYYNGTSRYRVPASAGSLLPLTATCLKYNPAGLFVLFHYSLSCHSTEIAFFDVNDHIIETRNFS
jgi:hypothetical protein